MSSTVSVATPQTRIQELDIIRGFALFGVFAVNLSYSLAPPSGPTDRAIAWIVNYLFEDRFWPLFTFLFGLSFTILLTRAESRGHNTLVIYLRRMAVLFFFGALFNTFPGGGTTLVRYAAVGLLLVPLRRVRSSVLIALSAGLFLLTAARVQDFVRARWTPEQRAVEMQRRAENRRIETTGTFAEVTLNRGKQLWHTVSHSTFLLGATSATAAVFLPGLAFAHTSVLGNLATRQDFLRRAFFWCLLAAGVTRVVLFNLGKPARSWPYPWRTAWIFFDLVSATLQGLSYAAGLAVVLRRPLWRQRLGFLAPAGRMTLTNYILQSLLYQILFDRFFLQLKLGPAAGFVLTMGLFALQVAFSKWRLRKHRYGPLEQLWRYLTYGSARYRELQGA